MDRAQARVQDEGSVDATVTTTGTQPIDTGVQHHSHRHGRGSIRRQWTPAANSARPCRRALRQVRPCTTPPPTQLGAQSKPGPVSPSPSNTSGPDTLIPTPPARVPGYATL